MDPKLNIPRDLGLDDVNVPDVEEVNNYLRDELYRTNRENEELMNQLHQKDAYLEESQERLSEMEEKLKEYDTYCGNKTDYRSSTQLAQCKIVELSKRLRDRTAEIGMYKNKCSTLQTQLTELKQKSAPIETEKKAIDKDELQLVQEKLAAIRAKWADEKSRNAKLKNDLKLADKWLQQEVGDKFETLITFNTTSSWRGRAQIIQDLQRKNSDLKEKLKSESKDTLFVPQPNKKNDKTEALTKENSEIRTSCEDLKTKLDGAKARCRVLESECVSLKSKITALNEKSQSDQEQLADLKSEVAVRIEQKDAELRHKEALLKTLQEDCDILKIELEREKCLSINKSKELIEKNDDITLLNKRIRSARPCSSYMNRTENNESKTISLLEVERLRLLELTETQKQRLDEERNAHLKTQHDLRREKQKNTKLGANLARLELEQSTSGSTYSSRFTNSKTSIKHDGDVEDQLELAKENIKALTSRLQVEMYERTTDLQDFKRMLMNYTR